MILVLLSFLIIAIYTGVMIQREKEVPYSISATYYSLKNKFWFGTCMIGASLLLLPSALDVSTEDSQFLVFLSVVGMAVLGVSPNFKTEQKTPHVIGACMSLIFSQIWVGCNAWYWLLLWAVFIVYVIVSAISCATFRSFRKCCPRNFLGFTNFIYQLNNYFCSRQR